MSTGILACSALSPYVCAAQKKMKTNYQIIEVDRNYHDRPNKLRLMLMDALKKFPKDVDTILVAMGACGNSWEGISWKGRLVIPKMDDCITILLHTNNDWYPNLKKAGHFYQIDEQADYFSLTTNYDKLTAEYGKEKAKIIYEVMFGNYTNIDIVDTGIFDCHNETYVAKIQQDANLIQASLSFVKGSNRVLEKLVAGDWDHQFMIVEQGRVIKGIDFLVQSTVPPG